MTAADTKDLARQFLGLWQNQLASMAKDPDVTAKMMDNFRLMQQSTLAWMQFYAAQQPQSGASVPGDSKPAGPDLERRLAECEARLAAVERQLKKQGRKPA